MTNQPLESCLPVARPPRESLRAAMALAADSPPGGLQAGQQAGSEASRRRYSAPVTSPSTAVFDQDVAATREEAMEEVTPEAALLAVFELCHPRGHDCAISVEALEKVLHHQVGSVEDVQRIMKILSNISIGRTDADGHVDFFSYWLCMETFFHEQHGLPQAVCGGDNLDAVQKMQQLRDHVLAMSGAEVAPISPTPEMLSAVLDDCVQDQRHSADLLSTFANQNSMPLARFAGIIYACLKKHLETTDGDNDGGDAEQLMSPESQGTALSAAQSPSSPKRFRIFSIDSCASDLQHRKCSLESDPEELQPMCELVEIVEMSMSQKDRLARSALARILTRYESLSSKANRASAAASECDALREELQRLRESCEDMDELRRECEKYKRCSAASEKQIGALEEQCRSATQKLDHLRQEHADLNREHADHKRRMKQLRDYCDNLEASNTELQGRSQQLGAAAKDAEEKSMHLTNELKRLSFSSSLADVLRRRSSAHLEKESEAATPSSAKAGREELAPTPPAADANGEQTATSEMVTILKRQLEAQQVQLQSLRGVRNELFNANDKWTQLLSPGEKNSSSASQQPDQCSLLASQLRAMLHHTQRLEELLDNQSATPRSGDWKSQPRESLASTSVGSFSSRLLPRESIASTPTESSHGSSIYGEAERPQDFLMASKVQVRSSPKKDQAEGIKKIVHTQRYAGVSSLQVPEARESLSGGATSRTKSREKSTDPRHSKEGRGAWKEPDDSNSWMPDLASWYNTVADKVAEEDKIALEIEARESKRRHKQKGGSTDSARAESNIALTSSALRRHSKKAAES